MTSILVVCSGNICRSPVAEGLLRDALVARFAESAPDVSSAGTIGWEGSGAAPESVQAAAERGTDISTHVARLLTDAMIERSDLIVCMALEHRWAAAELGPREASKAFTLKELVRLLEHLPPASPEAGPESLTARIAEADAARRAGFRGNPEDDDIADPLGMPITAFRAMVWDLEGWTARLVDGLYGLAATGNGSGTLTASDPPRAETT